MRPVRPKTDRVRARFAHSQRVHGEPEAVFPLLCPVREHDWIPAWECRLVYTSSGLAETGCVFQTEKPGEGLDTWVVSHHEPSRRVSFVRINPLRAIRYDIRLTANGDGTTTLDWSQEITALGEDGDRFVAALREEDFVEMIETLERMLDHYLETGEPLEEPH